MLRNTMKTPTLFSSGVSFLSPDFSFCSSVFSPVVSSFLSSSSGVSFVCSSVCSSVFFSGVSSVVCSSAGCSSVCSSDWAGSSVYNEWNLHHQIHTFYNFMSCKRQNCNHVLKVPCFLNVLIQCKKMGFERFSIADDIHIFQNKFILYAMYTQGL